MYVKKAAESFSYILKRDPISYKKNGEKQFLDYFPKLLIFFFTQRQMR